MMKRCIAFAIAAVMCLSAVLIGSAARADAVDDGGASAYEQAYDAQLNGTVCYGGQISE